MAKLVGAYETIDHREVNGWTVTLFRNLSHNGTQPHGSFSATVREGVSEDVLSFYGETREAVEREVLHIVGVSPLNAAALVEENAQIAPWLELGTQPACDSEVLRLFLIGHATLLPEMRTGVDTLRQAFGRGTAIDIDLLFEGPTLEQSRVYLVPRTTLRAEQANRCLATAEEWWINASDHVRERVAVSLEFEDAGHGARRLLSTGGYMKTTKTLTDSDLEAMRCLATARGSSTSMTLTKDTVLVLVEAYAAHAAIVDDFNRSVASIVEIEEQAKEITRLRAALADIARGDYSDPLCMRTPEQRAREALASKKEKP